MLPFHTVGIFVFYKCFHSNKVFVIYMEKFRDVRKCRNVRPEFRDIVLF